MWTPTTREQHSRKALRYQTDLTDAEWVVIEPHLPPAHGTGRPRSWPIASGSDARPARAARLSTARASRRPRLAGPRALRCGQEDQGAQAPRAGRHRSGVGLVARGASGDVSRTAMVAGLAVRLTRLVSVHREGLCRQRLRRREGRHGHRDRRRDRAQKPRSGRLQAVQPRRWVVERFFAWINRNRRLAKDFEASIASARAFLYAASVMLLVRRLARAA